MNEDIWVVFGILGAILTFFGAAMCMSAYSSYVTNEQRLECVKANTDRAASEVLTLCGRVS
jgi:hypothetical protein